VVIIRAGPVKGLARRAATHISARPSYQGGVRTQAASFEVRREASEIIGTAQMSVAIC